MQRNSGQVSPETMPFVKPQATITTHTVSHFSRKGVNVSKSHESGCAAGSRVKHSLNDPNDLSSHPRIRVTARHGL